MFDEGYIKFRAVWEQKPPFAEENITELNRWRKQLYEMGLIGVYPNGIGFGNISQRWDTEGRFIISGSTTGRFSTLTPEHYTLVSSVDLANNTLHCEGPIIASSESMSHAVFYQECPQVNGVIHVHSQALWEKLLHQVPTTDASATYGSPEMAYSIIKLIQETDLLTQKILVMEGHPEGIFVFGADLEEAGQVLIQYLD